MEKDLGVSQGLQQHVQRQKTREFLLKHARTVSPRAEQLVNSVFSYFDQQEDLLGEGSQKTDLKWDYNIESSTISPICTKTVGYNGNTDKVFRCFDCLLTGNAIQCADCFSASDHKGHNYIQFFQGPGCCDCGNSQMWNQKGFCPSHAIKQTKISISPQKQRLFHQQMQLAFWLYFWLLKEYSSISFSYSIVQSIVNYIVQLMQNCNELASKQYQYKVLFADLFHSSFQASLPKLDEENRSILWRIFNLPIEKQEIFKELFLNLTMQLFPVDTFRTDLIKIYFQKTKNDEDFTFEHPFRLVNFQFMTCLSTIIKLLKTGQIKPIIPYHMASFDTQQKYINTFIKHYDDLFYIQQMKKARDYNLIMMEENDLSESAYYRSFNRPLVYYSEGGVTLDDHYVKIMGLAIQSVADRKDLLEKQMRNLIKYVLKIEEVTSSMAQQRLFAMIVTAYFNGDITQLRHKEIASKFIDMLDLDNSIIEILEKLVFHGLKGVFKSRTEAFLPYITFYSFQFFQQYDQRQISNYLDIVYHKILFLLSKNIIDYGKIVEKVMNDTLNSQLKMVIPQFLMMMKYGDVDELVVSYYLKMGNEAKLMAFYASLVEANKQKYAKEIKQMAGIIISCLKQFEWFIKNKAKIDEKGKIHNLIATEPLVTCIYEALFVGGSQEVYPDHIPTSQVFQQLHIFTEKSLKDFKDSLLQSISLSCPKVVNQRVFLPCRLAKTLIKYYLMEQTQKLDDFFIDFILPFSLQNGLTNLSSLINKIFKQKISSQSRQTQQHDMASADKRKKERIAQLKKQKEQKIKKQQELHLNMHKDLQQQSSEEVHQGLCIICREDRHGEPLHLISQVDISDIIEKSVLKIEYSHISIKTCGHQIHNKCFFDNSNNKNGFYQCFLCKRSTNILIPYYTSSTTTTENLQKDAAQFMEKIYLTLLEYRADIEQHINILMMRVNYNIIAAILQSLVFEIISIQFEEENYFKRYVLPAYKAIFTLTKKLQPELIMKSVHHQYEMLHKQMEGKIKEPTLRHITGKFGSSLIGKMSEGNIEIEAKQEKDSAIMKKIDHLFELLEGNDVDLSVNDIETKLTYVQRDNIFYPIPQELTELHTRRGECPHCHKFSSQILLCLQCGWKCCWDQLSLIGKHSKTSHLNGCAFIKCYDGRVVYVYNDKALTSTTIYENYLGEPFTYEKEMQNVHKFKVNKRKLEEVHRHIFNSEIREQIKY